MNLVAYCRVSTTEQTSGFGLATQEEAIRSWAKSNGHRIAAVFTDAGVSGTKEIADRPGLAAAIDSLLPPPQASGLVVARARSPRSDSEHPRDGSADGMAGGWFRLRGRSGRSAPGRPRRPHADIRQTSDRRGRPAREVADREANEGRQTDQGRAGRLRLGAPPFGDRAEGRELVVEPDEAATLSRILELDRSGASLRAIGSVLEAEGRGTKRGGTRLAPPSARRHPSSSLESCGVMARLTYSVPSSRGARGVEEHGLWRDPTRRAP